MDSSNSFSSIISSFQVCTRSLVSSFSVMSGEGLPPVNPEVAAPTVGVAPGEAPQSQVPDPANPTAEAPEILPENRDQAAVSDEVGFQVLEAELSSLKKAMLEVTAVDSAAVNIHKISSVDDLDEGEVAKAQLKVLLGIQSVVTRQYKTQQNSLTAQMVASRMAETCSQILGYYLKSVEKELRVWIGPEHFGEDGDHLGQVWGLFQHFGRYVAGHVCQPKSDWQPGRCASSVCGSRNHGSERDP